jgi:thiamine-phosphate pyrophosphorylase
VKLRGLYAITPDGDGVLDKVQRALEGGIALLQYRRKDKASFDEAKALFALARRYSVPFIVNDDLELALELGADGVHLGREDGNLLNAREKMKTKLVGASCYDRIDLARAAVAAGVDYVAFGSVFSSPTKPAAVRAPLSLFNDLRIPLCAIGGITLQNAPQVIAAGADMVAVISDLFDAPDIARQAAAYRKLFQ